MENNSRSNKKNHSYHAVLTFYHFHIAFYPESILKGINSAFLPRSLFPCFLLVSYVKNAPAITNCVQCHACVCPSSPNNFSKDIKQRNSSLKITQLLEVPSNSNLCLDKREMVSVHVKGKIFHVESKRKQNLHIEQMY